MNVQSNRHHRAELALALAAAIAAAASGAPATAQTADNKARPASAPAAAQRSQDAQKALPGQNRSSSATAGNAAVAVMLVPLAVATADAMNNGCWVRFYSDQNFNGDMLAVSGPVALPNMDRAQPFWGEADSAVIGPKARVTTYDNDNFRDQTALLQPNQRIANLRDLNQLRWNEGIESVRVECTK